MRDSGGGSADVPSRGPRGTLGGRQKAEEGFNSATWVIAPPSTFSNYSSLRVHRLFPHIHGHVHTVPLHGEYIARIGIISVGGFWLDIFFILLDIPNPEVLRIANISEIQYSF